MKEVFQQSEDLCPCNSSSQCVEGSIPGRQVMLSRAACRSRKKTICTRKAQIALHIKDAIYLCKISIPLLPINRQVANFVFIAQR